MNYCPRGFSSLNPVRGMVNSLDMKQLPSAYIAYTALLIAIYSSVFGSVPGPQIYFLSRCLVYRSSIRGITFVNGQSVVSDCMHLHCTLCHRAMSRLRTSASLPTASTGRRFTPAPRGTRWVTYAVRNSEYRQMPCVSRRRRGSLDAPD
jgi:hypothetical protein